MTRPSARSTLAGQLKQIARELDALDRRWALVGGLAVHAHTRAGSMDDVDLAVATASDVDAERLVKELQERGFTAVTDVEQTDTHRLASVRLIATDGAATTPPIQILFASSGVEPEAVSAAKVATVLGLDVPVAMPGHLIAMKLLCHGPGRPGDAEDIASLLDGATDDDLRSAEEAIALITARGFSRGRDLAADYAAFVARTPPAGRAHRDRK